MILKRVELLGYDDSYTDLGGHDGGYAFYYNATNTGEVFSGTDAGILAGNLKLTTNTNSTTNTTGDLVVAGGAGIGQDVNIGGSVDIDTNLTVHGTTLHDDNIVIQGASKVLQLNNGSGTQRIQLQSTTGNASFHGVVDITNDLNINTNKFNVASATGNTLIAGTLGVTGVTTITGAIDANSTMGLLVLTSSIVKILMNLLLQQLVLTMHGKFSLMTMVHSDLMAVVTSLVTSCSTQTSISMVLIIQKETSTEVFNEQNSLKVRKKLQAGSQQELIPDYASHTNANLKVFGGAGIRRSLHIGARQSGEGLFIGKLNSGSNIEFQVIGDTGNTTIGRSGAGSATEGLLTVYGDTLLNRDLTVNGSSITLGNQSSDVLTVNADTTFNDDVTINGDNLMFTIEAQNGTDAFTVDSDNGNTVIAGTLDVDDATTITNTLNVTNGVDFDQTLNVDGAVDFNSTLVVDGQTTIFDTLIINAANEEFAIQNGSGVDKFTVDTDNGNTVISGTVNISGATQITNALKRLVSIPLPILLIKQ